MTLRVLIIDPEGLGLDFALRCAASGHQVKWFKPSKKPNKVGQGFRDFEFVTDWRPHMGWAREGLIITTGNARYIRELDAFRTLGFKIFAPTERSAKLEINRGFGMEEMQKVGIEVPPYEQFKSLKDAENFARKSDKVWVFKTLGSEEDKSLTYASHDPADMVGWLQRQQKLGMTLKGPCMLQEKIDMLSEMGVSGWFGPEGFLPERWQICVEHKALMNGEIGPPTGEQGSICQYVETDKMAEEMLKPMENYLLKAGHRGDFAIGCGIDKAGKAWPFEFTCYDDTTEVLTSSGWKLFKDVRLGERMATMDPETSHLHFLSNTAVIAKQYDGPMVRFKGTNGAVDLMVTPDHQMWVAQNGKKYRFKRADAMTSGYLVKRGYSWTGVDTPTFVLPEYIEKHWLGKHHKEHLIVHPAVEIPMEVWLRFLGLYIAEGSLSRNYITNIAQAPHNMDKIEPLLRDLPLRLRKQKKGYQVASVQLTTYLRNLGLGLCNEKFVPEEFKCLAPKYLSALLDGLVAGDGNTHKRTGQRTYFTSSQRLADDVQELMTKIGGLGRITSGLRAGSKMTIAGKTYARNHDIYTVSERKKRVDSWIDKRNISKYSYSGTVYCCDVPPFHLLYVRRNGVPVWCGNCRLGWPAFYIQLASHKGDPAQWMRDLLDGKDSLRVSRDAAIGVVMAQPRYPYNDSDPKEVEGVPISGCDEVWNDLHPAEMMMGRGPKMDGDKVVEGPIHQTAGEYVLTMTALGDTVEKARNRVYRSIRQVSFPNAMWRTDIGEKVQGSLKELHRFGFATELEP